MQETEPLDIIIVRRGQRSTGEAYILLRMPIQVELVLRKDKTYIGKRYVEVNLAKKLVKHLVFATSPLPLGLGDILTVRPSPYAFDCMIFLICQL